MPEPEELAAALESLAASLESSVPLALSRIEHVRVSAHAREARRLATLARAAAGSSAA